jgi:hypothetical protein
MALIVEDGTGRPDSEAYRSVADHRTYCAARGIDLGSLSDTDLEQDARVATDFMVQSFRYRWAGERATNTQALDFPRHLIPIKDGPGSFASTVTYYPHDRVPTEVGNAQSELMNRARAGALAPDQTRAIITETTGPITTTYDKNSPEAPRYRAVHMMLRPFLKNGGAGTVGVVRC